ncbi:MAG: restriction endonuclease subunit S [Pseudomonas aeruginosa]|nr:restriction endonuclease subunit S [Pseudomonas aeruginosa]
MSFIRAADMSDGQVLFNSAQCINELARSRIRKGIGLPGDVLLSHKGTVGKVAYAPAGCPDFVCSPQTTFWRVMDERVLDRRFLFAYMQSADFKAQLASRKGETDMADYVSLTAQRQLQIPVPGISLQREIGKVFSLLNDSITLLRETNATLEAIAQALFKSWFVDFDPVRVKAEGRQLEGLDATTAALFPDSFEESELGLVPKGWSVMPIGEAVECVGGGTPDTKNEAYWQPEEFSWSSPKDLSGLQSPVLLSTERKLSAQGLAKVSSGLLPCGTLLMSSRAPIGYLAIAKTPLAVNQGYIAMLPGGRLPPLYLLFWCREKMEVIKGRANGSTFMEISKKAFRPIPALVPSAAVLEAFADIADPLFERLVKNERQAQTLTQLRDTLLPRLISGQLRLPEAQALLNDRHIAQ